MKKLLFQLMVYNLIAMSVCAESEIVDGVTWNYSVDQGLASIVEPVVLSSTTGDVVIPSKLGGYPVNRIRKRAFEKCNGLTSLKMPPSITDIEEAAFLSCESLKFIDVSSGVTNIGMSAFQGCTGLLSVRVPFGVKEIAPSLFCGCCSMKSVDIPSSVMCIRAGAFRGCSMLESVDIPSCVTNIEPSAFEKCSGLASVNIPNGVSSITMRMFLNCVTLKSVSIPSTVMSIDLQAFQGCQELAYVNIPNGVTNISDYAFYGCKELQSVVIPSSVSYIGLQAFYGCTGLNKVEFLGPPISGMEDVRYLCDYAFVTYPLEYESQWKTKFSGVTLKCTIVSTSIRDDDPTVIDVVYRARSLMPMVKVQMLAFEDGERSFAKVIRPETLIDGTEVNVGDNITPNVEHKISWRVSADWQKRLAKMKIEVLASDGELLPLDLITILASDQYGKMKVSSNEITESMAFDALLWLYADKTSGLTCVDGVLKNGSIQLANGTRVSNGVATMTYLYGKMGYSLLTGAPLTYANSETELGLSPSGIRQYAYKIVEE